MADLQKEYDEYIATLRVEKETTLRGINHQIDFLQERINGMVVGLSENTKIRCLELANGDIDKAKHLYSWLREAKDAS